MDQELEQKISKSLDHIESMLSDEINIHPMSILDGRWQSQYLPFGMNDASHPIAYWSTSTRENSRYLTLQLKDAWGTVIFYKTWKCVYEDWTTHQIIDKISE